MALNELLKVAAQRGYLEDVKEGITNQNINETDDLNNTLLREFYYPFLWFIFRFQSANILFYTNIIVFLIILYHFFSLFQTNRFHFCRYCCWCWT
jgi:hypothetical protein